MKLGQGWCGILVSSGMLWAQAAWASPTLIQDVQVSQTADAIEIRLDVTGSPRVFISGTGTVVVVDLLDAQVARPIEKISPAPDIASISLNTRDASSVRLTVIGQDPLPPVQVLQEGDQVRLIWGSPLIQAQEDPNPSPESILSSVVSEPTLLVQDISSASNENEVSFELPQITVTAEKSEANVNEVPLSIRAIPKEEIEEAGIKSLKDIANNTINFSVFPFFGRSSTSYTIRGLGNSNFVSRDAVGFFVDDVPYEGVLTNILNILDVERIEVLRGPQSTLYGRSSIGGVVNVISRRPAEEFEINSQVTFGNYNLLDSSISVSDSITENLFYRLSGQYQERDGFIVNTLFNRSIDNQVGSYGRLQLLWTPSDDLEMSLNIMTENINDQGLGAVRLEENRFSLEHDIFGYFNRNTNAQSLRFRFTQPTFEITAITAHKTSLTDLQSDGDLSSADQIERRVKGFSELWSQEIRLQSLENESSELSWLLGLYFERISNENIANSVAFKTGFPIERQGIDNTTGRAINNTVAVFGQLKYSFSQSLSFSAGLRYEVFDSILVRADNTFIRPDGTVRSPFSERNIKIGGNIFLPRFSLEYRPRTNTLFYGTIAKGFRPPGVNFRPVVTDNFTFEPEEILSYEVGAKSSLFNNRLAANLALFYSPISNYQVVKRNPDPPFESFISNASVNISGAELELQAIPNENLELTAGLGITDAHFVNNVSPFTGESFNGNQLALSPNITYNLAISYKNLSGLFGRVEMQGFGRTYFDEANTLRQQPYSIFNLRIGYTTQEVNFSVFIDNLFDTRYKTNAFPGGGRPFAFFGEPRTIGVRLQSSF